MTRGNTFTTKPLLSASILKPMLIGAAIGLTLIVIFLSGTGEPNPEWGKYWMLRPLIIVPLAGAAGGAFFHFMGRLRAMGGWMTVVGYIISILGFIIALWMGSVVGLDGTYWN